MSESPPPRPHRPQVEAVLLRTIQDLVGEIRPPDAQLEVRLDSRLDSDLGLDSLAVAELLVRIEEVFEVEMADAILASAGTPRDLLAHLPGSSAGTGHHPAAVPRPLVTPRLGWAPNAASDETQTHTSLRRRIFLRRRGRAPVGSLGRPLDAVYGVAAIALFASLAVVVWLLVAVVPGLRRRWRLVRAAGRLLFRVAGAHVVVLGTEHLPSGPPYVVAANHASHLDPLLLAVVLPEPAVFVALRDLATNPLTRTFLRRMDVHLVERGDRVRGVADTRELTDKVRSGRVVAMFPEGRRSPAPGLEPFHLGAFVIAADAGVPVVPVALRGTRDILPVGRILPRRGPVTVTVAAPVAATATGWAAAVDLHAATRAAIERHSGEPTAA